MAHKLLKIVCAWCSRDMGQKDGQGKEGVSHSICDKCVAELEKLKGEVAAGRTIKTNKK